MASGGGAIAADPDDRWLLNQETGKGGRGRADEAVADVAVTVADVAKALLGRRAATLPPLPAATVALEGRRPP